MAIFKDQVYTGDSPLNNAQQSDLDYLLKGLRLQLNKDDSISREEWLSIHNSIQTVIEFNSRMN